MKDLKKYLNSHVECILLILGKPSRSFSPATFHNLRIEIKKLNALLNMINYCAKGFKRKVAFKPFKLLFEQAGKVRELQIEEKVLGNYFSNNILINYKIQLKKLQLNERRIFFTLVAATSFNHIKKINLQIYSTIEKIDAKRVYKYVQKNQNKIRTLFIQNKIRVSQIHELRKRLKEYYYNKKIIHHKNYNYTPKKNNELTEFLGKWHDYQIIIRHLNQLINTGKINAIEIKQLKIIKTKFLKESGLILKKIKSEMLIAATEEWSLF